LEYLLQFMKSYDGVGRFGFAMLAEAHEARYVASVLRAVRVDC